VSSDGPATRADSVVTEAEPKVVVATIRVFHRLDYVYLAPHIILKGTINIPHTRRGPYIILNGWQRYKQLRERYPQLHHPNFSLIDRLAVLKHNLTSRQMLSHPEAADLLLELVERNRRTPHQTLLEFLVRGEMFRQARLIKMMSDRR